MKIVHYISEIRREHGGVVRAVLDLCSALATRGHEVTLLVWNAQDLPESFGRGRPPPRVVVMPPPRAPLQRLTAEARRLAASTVADADVLHLHVVWDPVCLALARLAADAGVPYVVTPHGMLDEWSMGHRGPKKRLYLALAGRRMLRRAAAVHCASSGEADESKAWYAPARAEVVPLVVDLEPFREVPDSGRVEPAPPERSTVLFLGRLHRIKGIDRLIRALALLGDLDRPVRLLIAGNDEQGIAQELQELASALGVGEAVELLGFVDGPAKRALYAAADLFVLPSHHESFGYAIVESLLCGTPVVTTHGVKSAEDLRRSGGVVLADGDPSSLAAAIRETLADDQRRRTMGVDARAWCLEHLDERVVIERYEMMYERTQGGQRA